jgi:O-antigen ligase
MFRHYGEAFSFSGINPSLKPFFRNHVNYSALLACMVPLLLAFFTGEKRKATKNWIAVLTIICLLAVYLSYARGAWLAVILGIGAWWLVTKRKLFVAYILSMVFVFASLVWLVNNNNYLRFSHDYKTTIFHENFSEHLVATYQFKDVSTAERFYRWIAGVRMVKDNWQTGFGPNTFPDQYKYYTVPAFKTWVSANEDRSTVHNYFLTVTIEQGIPGLILLLLMVGYAFYTTEKIYHRSSDPLLRTGARTAAMLLTILCVVNFLSDLVETDKIGSVFYMTLAAIIVLQYKAYKEQRL